MKYLFIINPRAGSGRALKARPAIEAYMDSLGLDYRIELTKEPGQARLLVQEQAPDYQVVVAVGGDGTINEVATGLVGIAGTSLGIIPRGTANDLAKSLGLGKNLRKNLDLIVQGQSKDLDLVRVNDSYSFNVACIGLDAQAIVNYNNKFKFLSGKIKYILAVIYTIFSFDYRQLEIYIDGVHLSEEISLLAMGNGSYYGGFFKIMPQASLDDGLISVCLIRKVNRLMIFFLAPLLVLGRHGLVSKYVDFYKCEEILILSKNNIYLNLDGEILENTKLAQLEINGSIKIIC